MIKDISKKAKAIKTIGAKDVKLTSHQIAEALGAEIVIAEKSNPRTKAILGIIGNRPSIDDNLRQALRAACNAFDTIVGLYTRQCIDFSNRHPTENVSMSTEMTLLCRKIDEIRKQFGINEAKEENTDDSVKYP